MSGACYTVPRLGHSNQKITEDIYVHAAPADLISTHTAVFTPGTVHIAAPEGRRRVPPTCGELRSAIHTSPNWLALGRRDAMSDVGARRLHGMNSAMSTMRRVRREDNRHRWAGGAVYGERP